MSDVSRSLGMSRWRLSLACFLLLIAICGCARTNRAQLCIEETKQRLHGQVYRLAEDAIQASEKSLGDGLLLFQADVVLKPGTSGEETQSIECTVATDAAGVPSRVIGFQFIWDSKPASNKMPAQ